MKQAILVPALLLAAGCHVAFDASYPTVNGVALELDHVETMDELDFSQGFAVDGSVGKILVEHTDGPTELVVKVFERYEGDGYAVFADGKLTSGSHSGSETAIGEVTLRTNQTLGPIEIENGVGGIEVRGVTTGGNLRLECGVGDVFLVDVKDLDTVEIDGGTGDIRVEGVTCRRIEIDSGVGDVDLVRVTGDEAVLDSGVGDIVLRESRIDTVHADSGVGDIVYEDSEIRVSEASAGIGSEPEL